MYSVLPFFVLYSFLLLAHPCILFITSSLYFHFSSWHINVSGSSSLRCIFIPLFSSSFVSCSSSFHSIFMPLQGTLMYPVHSLVIRYSFLSLAHPCILFITSTIYIDASSRHINVSCSFSQHLLFIPPLSTSLYPVYNLFTLFWCLFLAHQCILFSLFFVLISFLFLAHPCILFITCSLNFIPHLGTSMYSVLPLFVLFSFLLLAHPCILFITCSLYFHTS